MTQLAPLAHIDFEPPDWGEWPTGPTNRPGYHSAVLADGPLACWRLGENQPAASVDDASGHGHVATMHGGLTLGQAGPLQWDDDTAFGFDGASAAVELPPSLTLPIGSPVTVMLWARTMPADVGQAIAFTFGDRDTPNRCSAHIPWQDGKLYWDYGSVSTGRLAVDYTAHLGKWTHIALVSSGAAGTFQAIYLDGEPAASRSVSHSPAVPLTGGWLGRNTFAYSPMFHRGALDEVAVFDKVLSTERISAIYRAGVGR